MSVFSEAQRPRMPDIEQSLGCKKLKKKQQQKKNALFQKNDHLSQILYCINKCQDSLSLCVWTCHLGKQQLCIM